MKGCRKKWIHDFPSLKSIHDSRAANAELILQDRTKQNRTCEVCIYTSALGTATLLGELCRELYKTCSRLELYYLEPRSKRQQGHMPAQEGCISAVPLILGNSHFVHFRNPAFALRTRLGDLGGVKVQKTARTIPNRQLHRMKSHFLPMFYGVS